jgi:acetyltransferase-like isoleucine patch superfamily enzyme
MLGPARSALLAARLYLWRRHEFDNLRQRRFFREKYNIDVGLYSYGCFDRWRMPGPIRVGRYCSIARTVRAPNLNHPTSALTTHPALYERSFGVVDEDSLYPETLVIEDDVWIGHNAVLLPGCKHVGRGAVIGAGAIITREVPAYAVMAGNPARKLRDRFEPDLAAAIDASRWWELDLASLRDLIRQNPHLVLRPNAAALRAWTEQRQR